MRASLMFFEIEMSGAYSDIESRMIVILTEKEVCSDGYAPFDAPIYLQIEQDEFTPEMAAETNEFC